MAHTLATRILSKVLLAHAVLLPLLAVSLGLVVQRSHVDLFLNSAHDTLERRVSELQSGRIDLSLAGKSQFLDTAILDGQIVYAELLADGQVLRSTLGKPGLAWPNRANDFEYRHDSDNVYFISAPVQLPGQRAILRLGFDETPTGERIMLARWRILEAMVAYLAVVVALALLLARNLARPLEDLRLTSHRIASGDFSAALRADSNIRELQALGSDLEAMRHELVGVNESLQRQLQERMALEAQLRQKQRLETVGTLASGLAHEINNVLVPITLYTESALDRIAPDHAAHGAMARVLAMSQRATEIIAKVLAFGRYAAARPNQPIAIATAVAEGVRTFNALRPATVELRTLVDADCGEVLAETTLIVQIVMNLCSNACQALPPEGGLVSVSLRPVVLAASDDPDEPPAGRYVQLEVADTGTGMDEATRLRIFDPFFTTREVGAGTGLGLSVVHGIVGSLGGYIRVRSAPGQGSAFQVLLPQVRHDPGGTNGSPAAQA
jgi:signal transduction histidine kinase